MSTQRAMPAAMAAAACATVPHPPPPPYPTSPKKRRFGTPRLRAITFSPVVWMLHLTMPSMSVARSPESSSACTDASSAETCSGLPMFFENGSCPMPTIAARLLNDTRGFLAIGGDGANPSASTTHRPGTSLDPHDAAPWRGDAVRLGHD